MFGIFPIDDPLGRAESGQQGSSEAEIETMWDPMQVYERVGPST